jgi:hypothetical protein
MGVDRRPFEIAAQCRMVGFPMGADISRLSEQIDKARAARPEVVRVAVVPPAVYRDGQYALQARFVVWARDGAGAVGAVEDLLGDAAVPYASVMPSGRALGSHEAPRPQARAAASASGAARARKARKPATAAKKAPKAAAAARRAKPKGHTRPAGRARPARGARPAARRLKARGSRGRAKRR